mmetsp:Transcript_14219/g.13783  ORF Transcript_14219/g.13783 Transcript_14219/m.13783 type:complete len:136 (+) Transcript_14219:779-1186(+)
MAKSNNMSFTGKRLHGGTSEEQTHVSFLNERPPLLMKDDYSPSKAYLNANAIDRIDDLNKSTLAEAGSLSKTDYQDDIIVAQEDEKFDDYNQIEPNSPGERPLTNGSNISESYHNMLCNDQQKTYENVSGSDEER